MVRDRQLLGVETMNWPRLDRFLGAGSAGASAPQFDGPFQPNDHLDKASVVWRGEDVDNLLVDRGVVYFSSRDRLMRLESRLSGPEGVARLRGPITALASDSAGALAVGYDAGGIVIQGGRYDGASLGATEGINCPTACLFDGSDTLLVCNGSGRFAPSQWKHDLMSRGATGSLWEFDLRTGRSVQLLGDLAFPYGAALSRRSSLFVSEAWRGRILEVRRPSAKLEIVLDELPGYPARIAAASSGGYWLTLFAPRTQLVEFVLSERRYRERMMAEIEPEYWVAPDLCAGKSFLEPLQGGGIKTMGILKPWAPPRSYGLVVLCDGDFLPLSSYHSRAGGRNHGITSAAELDGDLLATAKGWGNVLRVALNRDEESADAAAG
jgi:hypothetical protein